MKSNLLIKLKKNLKNECNEHKMQTFVFLKKILNFNKILHQKPLLGRWSLDNRRKTKLKEYYANEDHCGICIISKKTIKQDLQSNKIPVVEAAKGFGVPSGTRSQERDLNKNDEYYKFFIV